jgi:hypothetical protein
MNSPGKLREFHNADPASSGPLVRLEEWESVGRRIRLRKITLMTISLRVTCGTLYAVRIVKRYG